MGLLGFRIIDIEQPPTHPNYIPSEARWRMLLSKLEIWRLQKYYDRIVYMDADLMLLSNIDYLFDVKQPFISMEDNHGCGLSPGKVNSGLISTIPSEAVYQGMMSLLANRTIKEGDQEIIDLYWHKVLKPFPPLIPEEHAAFIWRCLCIKNKNIPAYDTSKQQVVHFPHWWLNFRAVARFGVALRSFKDECGVHLYQRWKDMYDAGAAALFSSMTTREQQLGFVNQTLRAYLRGNVPTFEKLEQATKFGGGL
eukprot:TRINITY_DN6039_c0_g2_i6.p1 TRINITY_DN6039_c0_g2~~TRINITY_DN6039_c0_g2_i6.p1  ORF type:complete len:252 (-),score=63.03 TRINITY_DN6039_c0_g2_i6:448-1203(-)